MDWSSFDKDALWFSSTKKTKLINYKINNIWMKNIVIKKTPTDKTYWG
jgi:hypothetical protein